MGLGPATELGLILLISVAGNSAQECLISEGENGQSKPEDKGRLYYEEGGW
jgi:hypothetical protein